MEQTRDVARQVNELGRLDAVIHNAGVYTGRPIMPVNVVATYLLTALIERPQRLVYLTQRHAQRWARRPHERRLDGTRPARTPTASCS